MRLLIIIEKKRRVRHEFPSTCMSEALVPTLAVPIATRSWRRRIGIFWLDKRVLSILQQYVSNGYVNSMTILLWPLRPQAVQPGVRAPLVGRAVVNCGGSSLHHTS